MEESFERCKGRPDPASELMHDQSFSFSHFHEQSHIQSQIQSRREQFLELEWNGVYTSKCARCDHIFSYPIGTAWGDVNKMVNDHWHYCPNSANAVLKCIHQQMNHLIMRNSVSPGEILSARQSENGTQIEKELSATGTNTNTSSGNTGSSISDATDEFPTTDPEASANHPNKRSGKTIMGELERKTKLEEDEWALDVQATSVKCRACMKTISLDKRSRYYPGLWIKHRGKCQEIKRSQAQRQQILTNEGDVNTGEEHLGEAPMDIDATAPPQLQAGPGTFAHAA